MSEPELSDERLAEIRALCDKSPRLFREVLAPVCDALLSARQQLAAERAGREDMEDHRDRWAKQAIEFQCRFQQAERELTAAREQLADLQRELFSSSRSDGFVAILAEVRAKTIEECIAELWKRSTREEYGHAKAAVMLDIEALRLLALSAPMPTRNETEEAE